MSASAYPPSTATITACPENDPLYATAIWYSIPGVSNFDACSHCYASYIHQTRWANRFRGELKASDLRRRCDFNTPRSLRLWSEALRYDNWNSITAYWAHRVQIANCQGATPLAADVGTKWYHPTYRDIDGFGICAACYEDLVCSTPFAGQFAPAQPGQPAGELWNCKMTKYLRRVMERGANWATFAAAATRSLRLPPCNGDKAVVASQRNWFQPVPHIDGLFVCETCHVNNIAASFMEANWQAMPPAPAFSPQGRQTRVCGLSVIALKVACLRATQLKDYAVLWSAAKTIFSMPYCAPGGIENGTWHKLRCGQGLDFDVCGQCFAGFIIPYGFGNHFVQMPQAPGKRTCDFNPAVPRQREYCRKLDESISLGNFAYFEQYARRFANIPPCPTYNTVKGRRWYGNNEFIACEQCWEEFVRDTPLASKLIHKGMVLPDGAFCDLYSARMRGLWMKACNTGNLSEFVAAAQHRSAVYAKTVPVMQQLLAMARIRFARKQTLMFSSVMLHGANNIAAASHMPGSETTLYGNDRVGWWETAAGAEGAADWEKANKINIVPGNEMMQVAQLEAMWKAVE